MSATRTECLELPVSAPAGEQPTAPVERQAQAPTKPQIPLPGDDRMISDFAERLGRELAPHRVWFVKDQRVVTIEERRLNGRAVTHAFREMDASTARTRIENYIVPYTFRPRKDSQQEAVRVRKTIGKETMQAVLDCDQFKQQLPPVERILELPVPMLHEGKVVPVRRGYDERFRTYCPASAPEPEQLTLAEAREVLNEIHREFCFVDETAKTMAIARMLTPYCRGLMGDSARPPVWMFEGNRSRAGKDYLAGCTTVLYEGYPHEEQPLGRNSEETQKRIMAAAQAGRRMMHFANCKGHLDDDGFEQAATAKTLRGRLLGRNDAGASLQAPNEIEFSLSANAGFSYSEDFSLRVRKISLSFSQEDANARQFANPDLHGWIWSHRTRILGALNTLVRHWDEQGRPAGPTPFSSFPEWARVVGGIMVCCGLGDPCVSQVQAGLTGDESTENMRLLLKLAHEEHGEHWLTKAEITKLVEQLSAADAYVWFNPLERSHQTRFGKELVRFVGRELGGYRLERDVRDRSRPRFRVTLIQNPAAEGPSLRTCEPCEPPAPSSTVASGQKNHHQEGVCEPCEPCEPQTQILRDDSGGRMMPLPVDDGANPPLNEAKQVRNVRKVRMDEPTETARERLSRLCPVRKTSQSSSA